MKRFISIAAAVMICLSTGACSEENSSSENTSSAPEASSSRSESSQKQESSLKKDESSKKDDSSKKETPKKQAETTEGIAVISIETNDQSDDVMDFVKKPVSGHVAKSRKSWDPSFKIPDEPYYEDCTVSVKNDDGEELISGEAAKVKVRGNWTTMYDKKPLRIKFEDGQQMLGLNDDAKIKDWLLLAEYKDISLLRNRAAFFMGSEILGEDGYYCSDSRLVEVTINGEYWGVYLLAEQQEINSDRVDITKAEDGYEGTDIGYFLEFDGYYTNEDELNQFYVTYNGNAALTPYDGKGGGKPVACLRGGNDDVGITIKSKINCAAQRDFIAGYVNNVYKIMYEAAYNDKAFVFNDDYSDISESSSVTPREAVEAVVDVRSLVDSYILCELTCDADLYWSSFFMSVDFGEGGNKKLTFEAPWDFDSALGNKNRCAKGTGYYAANTLKDVNDRYKTINPWLAVLMYEDWYMDMIKERWTEVYDGGTFDRTLQVIADDTEKYAAAIEKNYERWNNIKRNEAAGEWCAAAARCKSQPEAAEYLSSWISTRVDFLNGEWHT